LLGAIPALATGIVLAAAATGAGESDNARSGKRWKPSPPEGSTAVNFSAYYLGDAFQRHALTKTLRVCNKPHPWEPVRGNYISYIYGDCVPGSDSGCAPPVEVQSAPACERRPSRRIRRRARRHQFRGVPVVQFPGESRLELFTGDATVVIFGAHTPRGTQGCRCAQVHTRQPCIRPGGCAPAEAPPRRIERQAALLKFTRLSSPST
jgi:hypothetical protein